MPLVTRGVRHPAGYATSLRLAPAFWSAIADIAKREGITRDQVVARAWRHRDDGLSTAVRSFCIQYYRKALVACEAREVHTP